MTKSRIFSIGIAALCVLLGACSGSALVTLNRTGQDSPFATYMVDVTSVVLTGSGGASKQVLSQTTRVDLADPAHTALLLSTSSLSSAEFSGATVTLDYSNADIRVDVAGVPTAVSAVDANGAALTQVQVPVQFSSAGSLSVGQVTSSRLALSVDLQASNAVDFSTSPIQVIVRPAVSAQIDPADTGPVQVGGTLSGANSSGSSTLALTLPTGDALSVHIADSTQFEIGGAVTSGTSGASALNALGTGAACQVFGQVSSGVFTASRVLAGGSIAGASIAGGSVVNTGTNAGLGIDTGSATLTGTGTFTGTSSAISGTVIARSGGTLTVRNARIDSGSSVEFMDADLSVLISDATVVTTSDTLLASSGNLGFTLAPVSISVGQRITATGIESTDTAGLVTLDATGGVVRLESTLGWGLTGSSSSGAVVLNLQQLDGLPAGDFDFAGTELSGGAAVPARYQLATGSLNLSALGSGSLMQFAGVAAAFLSAPPNFIADRVTAAADAPAHLILRWSAGGGAAVLSTIDSGQIVADLSNPTLGTDHDLVIGPQTSDLKALAASPPIVPDTSAGAQYGIQSAAGAVTMYASFADFSAALKAALSVSTSLATLSAHGRFDSGSFRAADVLVQLQ